MSQVDQTKQNYTVMYTYKTRDNNVYYSVYRIIA